MARMYPERLPTDILVNPRRSAECKVYQALSQLPNSFTVFYSVAWQMRDERSGARDGETDFIVAHPNFGLIILEVKGGRIRYDANFTQWYSTDRLGIEHKIKDPLQQSRDSKGALLSKLATLPGWDNRWLTIGYMAVFPDVDVARTVLRPDLSRDIVLDAADLEQIEPALQRGFAWYAGQERSNGALGPDRLEKLVTLLAHSFTLSTRLGTALAEEDARLIELTEQQMGVLQFIQHHRRALIEGCAGSGKTLLALEKARQLAAQGFDTLLICFNAPLAEYLRQRAPEEVDVFHFHGLCQHLAKQAGMGFRASDSEQDYYDRVLPDMLCDAISELGPQYDAVVVDEGQDFLEPWWEILVFLLRDDKKGVFYAFYDNNQNIYHRPANLDHLVEVPPLTLWENCRNTQAIHRAVSTLHHNPRSLACRGPEGRTPETYFYSDAAQQERWVQAILYRLVHEERIVASQIVLLTTRAPEKTPFPYSKKLGNFKLIDFNWAPIGLYDVRVSSVHRFKGLESRVVIVTGMEDNDPMWLNPLLYVACSRARTHLILVGHERARPQIELLLSQPTSRGTR